MICTEKEKRDGGLSLFNRYHSIIENVPAFEAAMNRRLNRFIWANTPRIRPDQLCALLQADGYTLRPLPWHRAAFRIENDGEGLGNHWAFLAGLFHIQEASAMIPPLLLVPKPGDRVLDLCAAPGNKTAQLALLLENSGTVVGNDLVSGRLRALRSSIDRLGFINICVTCYDGINFPKAGGDFDAVIADVPCGCEGVSRRRSSVTERPAPRTEQIPQRQLLLLKQAVRRCRKGGRIVYSTCTYAPEENEAVVDALLREWPDQVRILPGAIDGLKAGPGLVEWEGQPFHPDLKKSLRIWPHLNDTAGFYAVLLEKTGDIGLSGPNDASDEKDSLTDETIFKRVPEPEPILGLIRNRFAIPFSAFDKMELLNKGDREIWIVSRDHQPPPIKDRAMGMPLIHIRSRYPKMTTAGAAAFGPLAARNVVDVDLPQLEKYLCRERIDPSPEQTAECDDEGYVIIRHRGFGIGMGLFIRAKREIRSHFPKHSSIKS